MSDIMKEIIQQLKNSDIEEVKIENGDFKFSFKRDLFSGSASAAPQVSNRKAPQEKPLKKRVAIKSPMVGRFFNSPAADHPPFVMKGNHVVHGQKVGVVEAMKIFKDVISSVEGVIVEVLVENNTPVEYGQELYMVEIENQQNE